MRNRSAPSIVPSALFLAAMLAHGGTLLADTNNTARVTISPSFGGGSGPVDNIVDHSGACDASGMATGGFNSSGSGTCHVVYGYVRVGGEATGSLNTGCLGTFRDTVTLVAPGVPNGGQCVVSYSVAVHGMISATSGASGASWSLRADLGDGAFDMFADGGVFSPDLNAPPTGSALGSTFTSTPTIGAGLALPLLVQFRGSASAGNNSNSAGHASFGNLTCRWLGINSVTYNGNPVLNWSVTSQSGTNWGGPVTPCPADLGGQGGVHAPDGVLDNNDFIVFIDDFFAQDPAADVGVQGGVAGHDGVFDNNDFIVFIGLFFAGC